MELSWLTIAASLAMGLGTAFLFVFAVKRDWFKNIEEAKFQVFWSDLDEKPKASQERMDGHQSEKK